ncbi:hypothetical protein [Acinetobacter junii]|uniref:hypothetical protein n=1 Tax=Acinetobacter junii TaxID=40215 RepID=UPI0034CD3653
MNEYQIKTPSFPGVRYHLDQSNLHDKQELIQKFLDENIPRMANGKSFEQALLAC